MTKEIKCGNLIIGGNNPILIQSMTNVDTRDTKALHRQIDELKDAGADIVRVAIPNKEALESFAEVKKHFKIPLVADIHFDYKLAIGAIRAGADKIRINPGNIGSDDRLKQVIGEAKEYQVPIRVGVNGGSISKDIIQKYGGLTKEALIESAVETVRKIENMNFENLVLSIKSSDVKMNYDAYAGISEILDYPLHVGVTEAGFGEMGKVKSIVGIGSLLIRGIGDTIRVSITENPIEEIKIAKEILWSIKERKKSIDIISCPTCGRTKINLIDIAEKVQARLKDIEKDREKKGKKPLKIAIMGCPVNGPGEATSADFGITGTNGKGLIFARGEIIEKTSEDRLIDRLVELIGEAD